MRPSRLLSSVRLPKLPIVMPTTGPLAVDAAGMAKPPSEAQLVEFRARALQHATPVPNDAFMAMPTHDSLKHIARSWPYHQVAGIAMEHSMFTLFDEMLMCHDAPLPHVIYTDLLQCKTFASLQSPPDEQFTLPAHLLRSLLQMASFHLLHDVHYFGSVEKLYRTIELQQTVGSEVMSAWVQCCVFAGKTALAVQALQRMEANEVAFDAEVFCSMMAPTSVGHRPDIKGDANVRLAHNRLHAQLTATEGPAAVGLHAAYVANSLLMRHAAKWEVLRMGLGTSGVNVCSRTMDLAAAVLDLERGARCGPKTNEALAVAFAETGKVDELFKTLYYMRCVEQLPQYAEEPMGEFSEVAVQKITRVVKEAMAEHPEKRLKGSSALYLMNHTADEFHAGVRQGGPLQSSLRSAGEKLQFSELLGLMGYGEKKTATQRQQQHQLGGEASGTGGAITSTESGGLPSSAEVPTNDVADAAEAPAPIDTDAPSPALPPQPMAYRRPAVSRLAEIEAERRAKEEWARARMATAWMNPDSFTR